MDLNKIINVLNINKKNLDKFFNNNHDLMNIRNEFLKEMNLDFLSEKKCITSYYPPSFLNMYSFISNYIVSSIAHKSGIPGINFVNDIEEADYKIKLPYDNKVFTTIKLSCEDKTSYYKLKVDFNNVKKFLVDIEKKLSLFPDLRRNFRRFSKKFLQYSRNNLNFYDTVIFMRREFEKSVKINVYDIKISKLIKKFSFLKFVLFLLNDIESFISVYNKACISNNIKSMKLKKDDKFYELPFFAKDQSGYYRVYYSRYNTNMTFEINKKRISIDTGNMGANDIINCIRNKITIYPEKVIISILIRLFFSDYMIYYPDQSNDRKISDQIFKEFFNIEISSSAIPDARSLNVQGFNDKYPYFLYSNEEFNTILKNIL